VPLFLDKPTQFFILSKQGGDDVVLNVTPDFYRDIPPAFANESQPKHRLRCLGIVNGVIGLQWGSTCLALWNPATREFKEVPRWPIMPDNKGAEEFGGQVLGLGFDLQSQDFKILGLIDCYGAGIEPNVYEYHLYSLKANSWKKVKEALRCELNFHHSQTDAYLNNGVYYWRAEYKSNNDSYNTSVIVAFNFNTELFTEFELPKDACCHNREHMRIEDGRVWDDCTISLTLGKYKEMLALFVSDAIENSDCYVELWVATSFREDDHGVPLSWQLVVRVSPFPSFRYLYIHKFRECGDVLIVQYGNSGEGEGCLYDPTTSTFNNLGVRFCYSFTYVESLFSIIRMLN
ncbi:hypothetical protein KSS87_012827, partial [Heliosperma pusillum]